MSVLRAPEEAEQGALTASALTYKGNRQSLFQGQVDVFEVVLSVFVVLVSEVEIFHLEHIPLFWKMELLFFTNFRHAVGDWLRALHVGRLPHDCAVNPCELIERISDSPQVFEESEESSAFDGLADTDSCCRVPAEHRHDHRRDKHRCDAPLDLVNGVVRFEQRQRQEHSPRHFAVHSIFPIST